MRNILGILVVALVVVFVLSFTKDVIIKVSAEKSVEMVTGLGLRIKSLQVGLIKTLIGIKDLRLYNPKGYKDRVMLDMPEVYVDYDLAAAFKGKVHLTDVRIDLKEFVVVKNERGELNLDSLKVVQAQKEGAGPGPAKKGVTPEIWIDNLELKVGRVIYKDYSKGGEPSVQEFNVDLNEKYSDVKDMNKLVAVIMVQALKNTTIARLTGFDLKGMESTVSDTLSTAQEVTAGAIDTAGKTIKGVVPEGTHGVVEGATDSVKETTKKVGEVLKFPFGGSGAREEKVQK